MKEWIISVSVLIVITVIVRRIFHKKLKPMWCYLLWLPVLIRLLIPGMGFESTISIFNFVPLTEKTDTQMSAGLDNIQNADIVDGTWVDAGTADRDSVIDTGNGSVGIYQNKTDSILDATYNDADTQDTISGTKAGKDTQSFNTTITQQKKNITAFRITGAVVIFQAESPQHWLRQAQL